MVINKQSSTGSLTPSNVEAQIRRNTPQRMKILDFLRSVRTHPTAEEVFSHVRKDLPSITLATVYRNLNLLAEQGEILRLEIGHEYRYDALCHGHQHFICKRSGKIIDIENKKITDFAMKNLPKGLNAESVTIIYNGVCE